MHGHLNVKFTCSYSKHFTVTALQLRSLGTTKFVTSVRADMIAVIRLSHYCFPFGAHPPYLTLIFTPTRVSVPK